MTLPRVQALGRHWRQYPPVHVSVAHALGTGTRTPIEVEANDAKVAQYADATPTMQIRMPK